MTLNVSGQHAARRLLQLQRMQRKLRSRRLDARLPVTLLFEEQEFACNSENISISGMFLYVPILLPDRAQVILKLTLPDEEHELSFKGSVVRLSPQETEAGFGMGLHLHDLDQDTYKDWSRFLAMLGKRRDQFPGQPRRKPAAPKPKCLQRIEVALDSVESLFDVLQRDISVGGLFVKMAKHPRLGAPVLLTFVHPLNQAHFGFTGKIAYAISHPPEERGVGVYFDECTYEQHNQFLAFIEEGLPEVEIQDLEPIAQDTGATSMSEA